MSAGGEFAGLIDGRVRIACAAWLATMASAATLLPLLDGSEWLVQAGLLLAAQTLAGMLVRWRGVPAPVTVAVQALFGLMLLTAVTAPETAMARALPTAGTLEEFGRLLTAGADDIGRYVAPAPATDGIRLLVFGGVLLIGLLVDLLAVSASSAAAAGLPLLALYSVAAGVTEDGPSWPYFLVSAAGYLLLLLAEGRDRMTKWGRFLTGPGAGRRMTAQDHAQLAGPRVRSGRRIGVLAMGAAVLAPTLLPTLGGRLVELDPHGSGGGGSGSITSVNPVVSLQDQLNQPQDRTLLTYETNSDRPSDLYLQFIALDQFDGDEWRSSGEFLEDLPDAPWPVPGLSGAVPARQARTVIRADESYAQFSLPVPYPAQWIEAAGGWRYDRNSQTLVSGDSELTSQALSYQVDHLLVEPTAEQLASAPPPSREIAERYTSVPDNLPAEVYGTALSITEGARNDYERAVALQEWFTQDGGFRYDTSVQAGSGTDAIVNFLDQREGFCVHFAFTMAAMARTLGIPAQVAVGFTPGERKPGGYYEVSSHNAHAWPELYFEGVGWVRFEPTPGQGSSPSYTLPEPSAPGDDGQHQPVPQERPSAEPTPDPQPSSPSDCAREPGACPAPAGTHEAGEDGPGFPLWPLVWAGVGLLLAAGLLVSPLLWRRQMRARRLAEGAGPLGAWCELTDSAWDFGITPAASETPRQAAERIVRVGALPAGPAAAAHRIADALETELYAPPGAGGGREPRGPLAADVRAVSEGLRSGAGRWARLRALLLPRSANRVMLRLTERRLALAAALARLGRRRLGRRS
ncbi:transglutaminaseTgpA domain-containing protein [Streptomyces hoynatensis]|uniref:transglutaminase family protein n=1 Tax=Streptomyces hoynatensis TaxID=1141874 RepID=UPI001F4EEAA6|nr:DUF3488 and transglutaminase-like domain-containing protein [Streptomyces hoynatensis]